MTPPALLTMPGVSLTLPRTIMVQEQAALCRHLVTGASVRLEVSKGICTQISRCGASIMLHSIRCPVTCECMIWTASLCIHGVGQGASWARHVSRLCLVLMGVFGFCGDAFHI